MKATCTAGHATLNRKVGPRWIAIHWRPGSARPWSVVLGDRPPRRVPGGPVRRLCDPSVTDARAARVKGGVWEEKRTVESLSPRISMKERISRTVG